MLHPSSPPWHPTRLHAYRVIHLPTMHEAAATVLDAYVDAQLIKWAELVELRREIPRGQPGPFTSALVAICAPTAYVVTAMMEFAGVINRRTMVVHNLLGTDLPGAIEGIYLP